MKVPPAPVRPPPVITEEESTEKLRAGHQADCWRERESESGRSRDRAVAVPPKARQDQETETCAKRGHLARRREMYLSWCDDEEPPGNGTQGCQIFRVDEQVGGDNCQKVSRRENLCRRSCRQIVQATCGKCVEPRAPPSPKSVESSQLPLPMSARRLIRVCAGRHAFAVFYLVSCCSRLNSSSCPGAICVLVVTMLRLFNSCGTWITGLSNTWELDRVHCAKQDRSKNSEGTLQDMYMCRLVPCMILLWWTRCAPERQPVRRDVCATTIFVAHPIVQRPCDSCLRILATGTTRALPLMCCVRQRNDDKHQEAGTRREGDVRVFTIDGLTREKDFS